MKKLKPNLKKLPFKRTFLSLAVINLLLIGLIFLSQGFLPPVVPLFYGRPQGEGQLARSLFLALPPAISLLLAFFNALLASWLKDTFLQRILLGLAIIVTVFSMVTVVKIALLVGSF